MAKTTIKNSTLFYHDWLKAFKKMSDEDVGRITKALLLLDSEGVNTTFEDNPILDIVYSQFSSTVERNREKYDESCQRKSEAAKKREAQKTTTSTTLHNCDDKSGKDRIGMVKDSDKDSDKKVCGVVKEREDVSPASPDTTTTPAESVLSLWNDQDCTISFQNWTQRRSDRLEMALKVAGGLDPLLDVIRGLKGQAYFRKRKVDFDWFINPEHFQAIIEGKYADDFSSVVPEGWEVIP